MVTGGQCAVARGAINIVRLSDKVSSALGFFTVYAVIKPGFFIGG